MKLQSSGGDNTLDEFFQAISDPATQGSPLLSTGHMNKVLSVPIRSEFLSSGGRRAVGERERVCGCVTITKFSPAASGERACSPRPIFSSSGQRRRARESDRLGADRIERERRLTSRTAFAHTQTYTRAKSEVKDESRFEWNNGILGNNLGLGS